MIPVVQLCESVSTIEHPYPWEVDSLIILMHWMGHGSVASPPGANHPVNQTLMPLIANAQPSLKGRVDFGFGLLYKA